MNTAISSQLSNTLPLFELCLCERTRQPDIFLHLNIVRIKQQARVAIQRISQWSLGSSHNLKFHTNIRELTEKQVYARQNKHNIYHTHTPLSFYSLIELVSLLLYKCVAIYYINNMSVSINFTL